MKTNNNYTIPNIHIPTVNEVIPFTMQMMRVVTPR